MVKKKKNKADGKTAIARKSGRARRVILSLDMPEANTVAVAGTFNNWNPEKHALKKNQKGIWTKAITLEPGNYEYKFIVDGEWINDPNCGETVVNSFGTSNSILTIQAGT